MNRKVKLFMAEDDLNLGKILRDSLVAKNYEVSLFTDGEIAWSNFNTREYDLCLLDVMMPRKDGFTLAKDIRRVSKDIPIIFLTAKNLKDDKIEGFNSGADDYLTKPFSIDELVLRIEAILRRVKVNTDTSPTDSTFIIGDYVFDSGQRILKHKSGTAEKLTTKEGDLLKMLAANINQILERDVALKSIWGNDNYFTGRSMDVYITKLRKYLRQDARLEIMNIHGTGFKLLIR